MFVAHRDSPSTVGRILPPLDGKMSPFTMIGRTISHYRIVRELGAGGMGVVFAAEDVRLGRQVAIKFVPDALADDRQLFERLRSEARTASALNHPNICIVHDV